VIDATGVLSPGLDDDYRVRVEDTVAEPNRSADRLATVESPARVSPMLARLIAGYKLAGAERGACDPGDEVATVTPWVRSRRPARRYDGPGREKIPRPTEIMTLPGRFTYGSMNRSPVHR
jgi:hypothetical protein